MRQALIFDPYLDTLGGGERYTLTVASYLQSQGYETIIAWNNPDTLKEAAKRFQLNLESIDISAEYFNLLTSKSDLLTRRKALSLFDVVFIVSDGSVPILFGKNKILHYQVPFTHINQPKLLNQIKLLSIDSIVVNSKFTKKVIDKTLGTNKTVVLYPPISIDDLQGDLPKEKIILNVGRFTSPSHSKRQDVLISAFKDMVDNGLKDWKLVLAGGKAKSDTLFEEFKELASGYPIEFKVNTPFTELKALYQKSSIYWHAAGFEVDEKLNPEAVEHFGMTTVEAMSAGCVPVVIAKGGQTEIITPTSGFAIDTIKDMIKVTNHLINSPKDLATFATHARKRSRAFSTTEFIKRLDTIIK